jgi:hypothetical protein
MNYWKVYCMEDSYPGLWHTWFSQQIATVGYAVQWGYPLRGGNVSGNSSWGHVRKHLLEMRPGDKIVAQLRDNHVGRTGTITDLGVEDHEWDPTVPRTKDDADGEQGRRIFVRWDLSVGPIAANVGVALPPRARLSKGREVMTAVHGLEAEAFARIEAAMRDEENWVLLQRGFDKERWLSDHIAESPHELEGGLLPYPSAKVREKVFPDGSRSDVLLLDREGNPVVVECKQGPAEVGHVRQLRGYMTNMEKLLRDKGDGRMVRGILVHGGARKLAEDVRRECEKAPAVETVRYHASVDFARSS